MISIQGRSTALANGLKQNASRAIIGLSTLNIIFAAAMAGIVSTQLDYQTESPYCYLNVNGQVCIFTYVTAGEIILYALSLIIPLVWLVMCITITIRGGQASDAGVPAEAARTTALAFAWLGTALTVLTATVLLLDLLRQRREEALPAEATSPLKQPASAVLDSSENSSDEAFKSV
ncbi:hypothetical protein Ndes2526B_g08131 [Nannochloris sp. 'desiccata']|nr:hypothetical protein KSW81_002765 [Chlorella desiccata (nom. nud.)]KAH7617526.1 hypothetical protein NADE_007304 [Chlorella desiccata (nom. nud.)]